MTTIFIPRDVHGSDKCWNRLLNAGKIHYADVIPGGGYDGQSGCGRYAIGRENQRVALFRQVFEQIKWGSK